MSNSNHLASVKIGINAATSTFGTEPAAYVPTLPAGDISSMFPRPRDPISREELITLDGRELPHLLGPKNLDPITLPLELSGMASNAGGAVADWEAKNEAGLVLAAMFGAVAPASTGAAPAVAASGHTPASGILEATTTGLANLDIVRIPTSTGVHIRQVVSGGGTITVTFDRPYTGTPTTAAPLIRLARYTLVPGRTRHKGLWIDYEDTTHAAGDRRKYKDCSPVSLALTVPSVGKAMLSAVFKPNDWADEAPANPSFAAPTTGAPIVAGDSALYLGAVEKLFKDFNLDLQTGFAERETPSGPNGIQGGEAGNRKSAVATFQLYLGDDDGVLGDIEDDDALIDMGDLQGDDSTIGTVATTVDVALQLGSVAGAMAYLRIPAGTVVSRVVSGGAYKVASITLRPTGATPLYLGIG